MTDLRWLKSDQQAAVDQNSKTGPAGDIGDPGRGGVRRVPELGVVASWRSITLGVAHEPWFTVRPQDFPDLEVARQILETYGEDRSEGRRVRFPVVFPSGQWLVVILCKLVGARAPSAAFLPTPAFRMVRGASRGD